MKYLAGEFEETLALISAMRPKFFKDGNQYCFLLGENIKDGIAGFGRTGGERLKTSFCNFIMNQNTTTIQNENHNL